MRNPGAIVAKPGGESGCYHAGGGSGVDARGDHDGGISRDQQVMFMTLALVYLIIVDVMGRLAWRPRTGQHMSFNLTG